jgi:hypothetical protein
MDIKPTDILNGWNQFTTSERSIAFIQNRSDWTAKAPEEA